MENQIPMAMATEIERGTKTQEDQWRVESQVFQIYNLFQGIPPNSQFAILELQRDKHIEYLTKGFKQLGRSFTVLDANRPWLCYWMLHSIALLRDCVDDKLENDCIDFLSRCQLDRVKCVEKEDTEPINFQKPAEESLQKDPKGGYGGGPGQMPHLATTYAAVNSLITLGGHRSLSSINRRTFYDFLLRMKERSGGFRMHDGGEVDVRACYTAISAASVLNILDDELTQNVGDYIVSCQTYEGGIAGEPGSEAHGGYTFCGLAAMILINEVHRLDLPALINWVVFRQGIECGFQGRTNKLVDGCYSFWQGGVAALIQRLQLIVNDQMGLSNILECDCSTDSDYDSIKSDISADEQSLEGTSSHVNEMCQIREEAAGQPNTSHLADVNNVGYNFIKGHVHMKPLFNNMALQQYILLCSQEEGGFRDKPGKSRDHYHTCYCLSGLSVSQYSCTKDVGSPPLPQDVLGPYSNLLERVHPLYNVVLDRYYEANEFFKANSL